MADVILHLTTSELDLGAIRGAYRLFSAVLKGVDRGMHTSVDDHDRFGGTQIVYFGNDWFAENRTSSHHIACALAESSPVLYIDSPGGRPPRATKRDLRKIAAKLLQAGQKPIQIGKNLWYSVVPQIPYRSLPLAVATNRMIAAHLIRRAMSYLRFRNPVLWFAVPDLAAMIGLLEEQFIVYYCVDDYSALPGVDKRRVAMIDRELTCRADQVFATSLKLYTAKVKLNPSTTYSPHGVDLQLFSRAMDPTLPQPEDIRDLKHPVIGYIGTIGPSVDFQLLRFLATERPNWTFLMVGLVSTDISKLSNLPNIRFVGPKPYALLPNWIKSFDVALYPLRVDRFTVSANPLKIREYLAAGKPVVSIANLEVECFSNVLSIGRCTSDFLAMIDDALRTDDDLKRAARIQAVSGMSWKRVGQQALEIVERRMLECKR